MSNLNRFIEKAQAYGAALLYAPEGASDPLANLGSTALSAGTLQNGAALSASGLVDGGAAVQLDGANDYIDTWWSPNTASGKSLTFVGLAKRSSTNSEDALFSAASEQVLLAFNSEGDIHFTTNEFGQTAHWDVNGALGTDTCFYALTVSFAGFITTARLYTATASLTDWGEKNLIVAPPAASALRVGHGSWAAFGGSLLPFAVFESVLTLDQIEELRRATKGTYPRVAVLRQLPSTRLAARIDPPGGSPSRLGPDEPDPANVLDECEFSGEMQGGWKDCRVPLSRNPRASWPDLQPFSNLKLYQEGGEVVWEGRIDKSSESDGDEVSIDVEAVGYQAALDDDKAVQVGFIDRDLSKWGDPSSQRRLTILAANVLFQGEAKVGGQDAGSSGPAIIHQFTRLATSVAKPSTRVESWYYGGGVDLGEVRYDAVNGAGIGSPDANWNILMRGSSDDLLTSSDTSKDYDGVTALGEVLALSEGRKYLSAITQYNVPITGDGDWNWLWRNLRVLGRHGLATRGEAPAEGFTAKQMLAYAVPLYASPLRVDESSMDDDEFVIPQAWFSDPGPMSAIVQELTKYGLLDWFVMEDKLFQLRIPGSYGRRWQAYAGPSQLKTQGLDSARLWESIVVRYQDVDGSTRTVGPLGSGAYIEDERLQITDPDHPAVKAGITRRDVLDLGGIGVAATAIAVGERWLEQANELSHAGEAELSGYVLDDKSVYRPAAQVRPGDYIRFPDSNDTSYRKIVSTRYTHSTRTVSVSLDAPPEGIQALLERLQVALVPLGIS